jgi:hypothetical protein
VQDDVEELALLMAEVCALSDSTLETPSARVVLDERRAVANLEREGDEDAERWFLDTGASNHMTGEPSGLHRARHQRDRERQVRRQLCHLH